MKLLRTIVVRVTNGDDSKPAAVLRFRAPSALAAMDLSGVFGADATDAEAIKSRLSAAAEFIGSHLESAEGVEDVGGAAWKPPSAATELRDEILATWPAGLPIQVAVALLQARAPTEDELGKYTVTRGS